MLNVPMGCSGNLWGPVSFYHLNLNGSQWNIQAVVNLCTLLMSLAKIIAEKILYTPLHFYKALKGGVLIWLDTPVFQHI